METNLHSSGAPVPPAAVEKQPLLRPALGLMGAHAAGVLIANLICLAAAQLMTGMGLLLCIPIVLIVYAMPVYGSLWSMGLSDSNKAHFGHIILDPWRGLKLSLIAMSPWLLSALLFLLSKLGVFWNFVVIYKIMNAEVWPIMNAVHVFAGEAVSAYLPDYSAAQAIICFLAPLLPLPVAGVAYLLGTKDISISQRLIYKKKQEPAKPVSTYEQYRQRQRYHGAAPVRQKEKESLLHKLMYEQDDKENKE